MLKVKLLVRREGKLNASEQNDVLCDTNKKYQNNNKQAEWR